MLEPGLDRHEWESRWQALEEPMADAPAETLPELDALVQQMLEERGYAIDDPVAQEGDDREIVAEFLSAREITRLLDERSDDVSPGTSRPPSTGTARSTSICLPSAARRSAASIGLG